VAGRGKWGARAGAFFPGAATESYSFSFTAGAFLRGRIPAGYGPGELPFEIGLDVSASDSDDGRVETTFLAAHATALFPLGGPEQESEFYLLGGYRGFVALSKIDGRSSHSALSAALDVGLGFGTAAGWDFRFTWSTLLSSDDLKDIAQLTAGRRF
jgi:hypothetical protein